MTRLCYMIVVTLAVSVAVVWGIVGVDGEGLTPFTCPSSGCSNETLDSNLADSTSFIQMTSFPVRRTNNTSGYDPSTFSRQLGEARLAQVKSVVEDGEMFYLDEKGEPYVFHATAHLWAVCAMQKEGIKNVGGGVNGRGFYVAPRPTDYMKKMAKRLVPDPPMDEHLYMVKFKVDKFWTMKGLYGPWVSGSVTDIQCDHENELPGCDYSAVTWVELANTFERSMAQSEHKDLDDLVGVQLLEDRPSSACSASRPVPQDDGCVWPWGFPRLMDGGKKLELEDITLTLTKPRIGSPTCAMTREDGSKIPPFALNSYHNNFVYTTLRANARSNAGAELGSMTGCKQVDDYATTHGWKAAYLASIEEITFKSPYESTPTLINGLEMTDVFSMSITKEQGKAPQVSEDLLTEAEVLDKTWQHQAGPSGIGDWITGHCPTTTPTTTTTTAAAAAAAAAAPV